MDFALTAEQSLLRDSARRFLADRTGAGATRAEAPSLWPAFAELGWLQLTIPEAHGGLGLTSVEVTILAEELGRHLVLEPWVAAIVLATGLLIDAGSPDQLGATLPGVIDGTRRLSLAHIEPRARACRSHIATRATATATGWVLDGHKTAVIGGDVATHFLISARTEGDVRDANGIALFIVPRTMAGLVVDTHPAVDGATVSVLTLHNAALEHAALLSMQALPLVERAIDRALTAWAAESVGAMEALLQSTIEYTRTRVQFGRPLAANQVIRHRLADMAVSLEEARSLALKATLADEADRPRAVAAAQVKVGRSARYVAEQAVQLHGAMGVTEELRIGAYLRRLLALTALFGPPEAHLRRHVLLTGRSR